jgi:hypothetical protein
MSDVEQPGWTVQGNAPQESFVAPSPEPVDYSAGAATDPWEGWTAQHIYREPVVDEVALALTEDVPPAAVKPEAVAEPVLLLDGPAEETPEDSATEAVEVDVKAAPAAK